VDYEGFKKINSIDGITCETLPKTGEHVRFVTVAGYDDRLQRSTFDHSNILKALDAEGLMKAKGPRDAGYRRGPDFELVGVTTVRGCAAVLLEDLNNGR
jgi:hypothetical protein